MNKSKIARNDAQGTEACLHIKFRQVNWITSSSYNFPQRFISIVFYTIVSHFQNPDTVHRR